MPRERLVASSSQMQAIPIEGHLRRRHDLCGRNHTEHRQSIGSDRLARANNITRTPRVLGIDWFLSQTHQRLCDHSATPIRPHMGHSSRETMCRMESTKGGIQTGSTSYVYPD